MISHLTTSHHLANLKAEVMYTENIIVVNYQSDRRCSKLSCANLLLSINVSKVSWGLLGPRMTLKADISGLRPNSGSYRGIFQHPKLPIFSTRHPTLGAKISRHPTFQNQPDTRHSYPPVFSQLSESGLQGITMITYFIISFHYIILGLRIIRI